MVPLILGSDKTLASNATGLNEFHPLYISPGNVKNSVRRAHRDSVIPIGFLAIPKSMCSSSSDQSPLADTISRQPKRWEQHNVPNLSSATDA